MKYLEEKSECHFVVFVIPHGVACDQTQSFGVKPVTEQRHSPMFALMCRELLSLMVIVITFKNLLGKE
jgi:hypothetical protein